jgi:hypothetical protein
MANAPEMLVEFVGLRRYGKRREAFYAIQLGQILWIKRWSNKKTPPAGDDYTELVATDRRAP